MAEHDSAKLAGEDKKPSLNILYFEIPAFLLCWKTLWCHYGNPSRVLWDTGLPYLFSHGCSRLLHALPGLAYEPLHLLLHLCRIHRKSRESLSHLLHVMFPWRKRYGQLFCHFKNVSVLRKVCPKLIRLLFCHLFSNCVMAGLLLKEVIVLGKTNFCEGFQQDNNI